MCGIFGVVVEKKINKNDFKKLVLLSRERGKDSSGFLTHCKKKYSVKKFNRDIKDVFVDILPSIENLVIGHSRLITNSTPDNQPVVRGGVACIHNGIIVNFKEIFLKYQLDRTLEIDTEILPALVNYYLNKNYNLDGRSPWRINVLPCGHTFHRGCIQSVEALFPADNRRCPVCRVLFVTSSNVMLGGFYNKLMKYQNKLII